LNKLVEYPGYLLLGTYYLSYYYSLRFKHYVLQIMILAVTSM